MRLPRARFTVRWLMVAVAVVGLLLGMEVRRRSLRARYLFERYLWRTYSQGLPREGHEEECARLAAYHEQLLRKYERAARYPWLPVAPDPKPE